MKRIAFRMLSSKPAVAAYGDLAKLPTLETVEKIKEKNVVVKTPFFSKNFNVLKN